MKLFLINIETNWTEPLLQSERLDITERMDGILRRAHRRGAFVNETMRERSQRMISMQLHPRLYPPPENGHEAFKLGFWLRENPFPEGTVENDRWRHEWRRRS